MLLTIRGLPEGADFVQRLKTIYQNSFTFSTLDDRGDVGYDIGPERWAEPFDDRILQLSDDPGFASAQTRGELREAHCAAVLFRGPGLEKLLRGEQGFHLRVFGDGSIGAVRVELNELASIDDAPARLRRFLESLSQVGIRFVFRKGDSARCADL